MMREQGVFRVREKGGERGRGGEGFKKARKWLGGCWGKAGGRSVSQ